MNKIKVLYLDDERLNLAAFNASFRRELDIFTALSVEDAIEILKNHSIEIIFSDQKMPGMTGIDFFQSILKVYPNPIRILITGFSDINAVIGAINKGQVYRYITKPWNTDELRVTINNAHDIYQLKEKNKNLYLKYKNVFETSTDPILIVSEQNEITNYNPAALEFLEDKGATLILAPFTSFFCEEEQGHRLKTIFKKKNKIKDYECELRTRAGVKKICLISGNMITNTYDELINYQFIIKDITERVKMNQLILKNIIETQEEERKRIARDLHDGIGQSLAALGLHLQSLKNDYYKSISIEKDLVNIFKMLKETVVELRRVCFNTLPYVLHEFGLVKGIKELQTNVSTKDFVITFNHSLNFPLLAKALEISIFRIIQEFVNNSIKHSCAKDVFIELSNDQENIFLSLKDNGIGFNIEEITKYKGSGLKNTQNRIESFKGRIKINSAKNQGVEFNIIFPVVLE
jgi:PAS domain S-box-containing protein